MNPPAQDRPSTSPRGDGDAPSAPAGPSRRAKLVRRTVTGASLGGAVALLIWLADRAASPLPVLAVGALLAAAAAVELARLGALVARGRPAALAAALVAALAGAHLGLGSTLPRGAVGLGLVAGTVVLIAVAVQALAGRRDGRNLARTAWLAPWVAVPLPLLAWIQLDHGTRGLVTLIVLSKVGDIAGYYVGSALGRHHPFPRLSPGKTSEGCLGSLVAGGLAGALLGVAGALPGGAGAAVGLWVGLVLNLASQAGDLLESHVKRSAGVKDSSTWLGASGGFLDVVDSLLLSVPAALLTWAVAFG